MGAPCGKPTQVESTDLFPSPLVPGGFPLLELKICNASPGAALPGNARVLLDKDHSGQEDPAENEATPAPPYGQSLDIATEGSSAKSDPNLPTPRALGKGQIRVFETADEEEESLLSLQQQLRDRSLVATPADLRLGDVLCTTCKSTVCIADWSGRTVVVKQVKRGLSQKEDEGAKKTLAASLREMRQELRILLAVDHPCLVKLLGASWGPSQEPFLITEHMEGGDVESYMQKKRREATTHTFKPILSLALQWAISTAEALTYLHGLRIIHRDVKPLNLLLSRDLQVKLTDFGISRLLPPTGPGDAPGPRMTGGVGTWRYMAPEVVRSKPYSDKADVYSFSLIVYFIFTGRPPFYSFCGARPEKILKAFLAGTEPRPDLDMALATTTMKLVKPFLEAAWHPLPQRRPTAAECLSSLQSMRKTGVLRSMHTTMTSMKSLATWSRAVSQ